MNHCFLHIKLLPTLFVVIVLQANFVSGAVPTSEKLLQQHVKSLLNSSKIEGYQATDFKKSLLNNQEWMHQLCDSGLVHQPDLVIEQLFSIWKSDTALTKTAIDQAMATACALEGPRKNRSSEDSVMRYQYFKKKHRLDELNTSYEDASLFQRRYLASGVQHPGLNTIESMHYLNAEVSLPIEQYGGAAYILSYRMENAFGASVFGPYYYKPYESSWETTAEMMQNVGGVCGSLSNFGAASAIANGVPASTMGEPGHCAYAILTEPTNWQASNSISWERGLHTSYYGGSWAWHLYNSKSQEDWETSKKSGDLRRLALYCLSKNKENKATRVIQSARRHHPHEWKNWLVSAQILEQTNASDKLWQELHNDTLKYLSPISGEVAFHFLDKSLYPRLLPKGPNGLKKRAAVLLAFQRSIKDWGLFRWRYKDQFHRQLQLLDGNQSMQDAYAIKLFSIHENNIALAPSILKNQLLNLGEDTKRKQHFISSITKRLIKSSTNKKETSNIFSILAKQALPDAAKNQDKKTFQFIGKMAANNYPATTLKTEPFPGVLLSSGGTFNIKNPGNRWDSPEKHWGVIEPHGGGFHTDSESPVATVQLKGIGLLTGVNIVQPSNYQRMVGAILQVSENNTDWKDVYTFSKAQKSYHIDLQDQKIIASHVRVIQPKDRYIHFNIFHVFGKKNS